MSTDEVNGIERAPIENKHTFDVGDYKTIASEEGMRLYLEEYPFFANSVVRARPEYALLAVQTNGCALRGLPKSQHTFEIVKAAITNNASAVRYASRRVLNESPELYKLAIKGNGDVVSCVPEKYWYEGIAQDAVESNGFAISRIPIEQVDYGLCVKAIRRSPLALEDIPDQLMDKELCRVAVSGDGMALAFVPGRFVDAEMRCLAVESNGMALELIPKKHRSKKICTAAVNSDAMSLQFVPTKLRTSHLQHTACLGNGLALEFAINPSRKDVAVAVGNNPLSLRFVPARMKTKELCLDAFERDWRAIPYIPPRFISADMVVEALQHEREGTPSGEISSFARMHAGFYESLPKDILTNASVASKQRELGFRHLKRAAWNKKRSSFVVEEEIRETATILTLDPIDISCTIVFETNLISELENYLEGKLDEVDFGEYEPDTEELKQYGLANMRLSAEMLKKLDLYDGDAYNKAVGANEKLVDIRLSDDPEQAEAGLGRPRTVLDRLEQFLAGNPDLSINYISDIHINHKLFARFPNGATARDIEVYVNDYVDRIVDSVGWRDREQLLLVLGDTSFSFETAKIFFSRLGSTWKGTVACVLGNHELWDGDCSLESRKRARPVEDIVSSYRNMLQDCGVVLLENELLVLYRNHAYLRVGNELLDEWTDQELADYLEHTSLVVIGGLGYSGLSEKFNASNGIYRSTIRTLREDQKRSAEFFALYNRVKKANPSASVVVATHMPKANWSDESFQPGWIYVSGHTHRNVFDVEHDYRVYEDNQVGYRATAAALKNFIVARKYDPFLKHQDGIHEVSKEDYIDFCREKGICIQSFTRQGSITMVKREGFYCFLFKQDGKEKLYLLAGARIKSIPVQDPQYYFDNLKLYADLTQAAFADYRAAIGKVSKAIKSIGGDGFVHGCIVDIDFDNHVYLDPFTGEMKFYYAQSVSNRTEYPTLEMLLKKRLPGLLGTYKRLAKKNRGKMSAPLAIVLNDTNEQVGEPKKSYDTSMYRPSNVVRAVQYLFDTGVVRTWNEGVLQVETEERRLGGRRALSERDH